NLARQVVARGLSVRETERLAKRPLKGSGVARSVPRSDKDADTRVLEQDLSANLKMKVVIDHKGRDGGNLVINYKTLEQLDELCQILSTIR
ncbi:MAG: chromosome partitioning protein ParB, partial [Albidovulum sp.]